MRGTISREHPWEVMPDLYFYRDPEEVGASWQGSVSLGCSACASLPSSCVSAVTDRVLPIQWWHFTLYWGGWLIVLPLGACCLICDGKGCVLGCAPGRLRLDSSIAD